MKRIQATVTGRVQGVGFRPTVARYAADFGLAGQVSNTPLGVVIEVEGPTAKIESFLDRLQSAPPPQARIEKIAVDEVAAVGRKGFAIVASSRSGDLVAGMPPDLATCADCLREINDPDNRRYRYPFTNCTNCGPRFTIIERLPYDRPVTSMKIFEMCPECSREYHAPTDRRYDAQPNACRVCGPSVKFVDARGNALPGEPIAEAARLIRSSAIVAVKGLGGYHLCCDATNDATVRLLRERKNRPHKSLAVMFASLDEAQRYCVLDEIERKFLTDVARPIVIAKLRKGCGLSALISPDTKDVGAFLPYTPLHHLLLAETEPLVMTSGNLADEPIAKDETELRRILGRIADYALIHDRPIVRRCDDSVMKMVDGKPLHIRRSRGLVPDHVEMPLDGLPVLACGAELKNTFCVTRGRQAFASQHIGDLSDYIAYKFFTESVADLTKLLEVEPRAVAHDLHPDYLATRYALESPIATKIAVQHHHAHIASCIVENRLDGKVVGVALDGSGYGTDGTIWGGEFLVADLADVRRAAHFRQYPLPGGDEATRNPVRIALSYLLADMPEADEATIKKLLPGLEREEFAVLRRMIETGMRSPMSSSAGRLFDAVSALLGLCDRITYEGQAAIRLQERATAQTEETYEYTIEQAAEPAIVSFAPMIRRIAEEKLNGADTATIARKFHNTVAAAVAETCAFIGEAEGLDAMALSGGVFQNDLLLRLIENNLRNRGMRVYTHTTLPPNDACVALGQAAVAVARLRNN